MSLACFAGGVGEGAGVFDDGGGLGRGVGGGGFLCPAGAAAVGGFFDGGGGCGAEVVGGFEAELPGEEIHFAEFFAGGGSNVEVEGLAHVDPFLAAGGGVEDVVGVDFEGGAVEFFEVGGDAVDFLDRAVVEFELLVEVFVPEAAGFEVSDEVGVDDGEGAGEVAFDVEVGEGGLNGLGDADDVGDGGGGGDGHGVGVAHAVCGDGTAHGGPVEGDGAVHGEVAAAGFLEEGDAVDGQDAFIPEGAFEGGVGAALGSKLGGGEDGVVGDELHGGVGKFDGGV